MFYSNECLEDSLILGIYKNDEFRGIAEFYGYRASAAVLVKNGFVLVESGADEDWGFPEPTKADKWIR